MSAEPLRILVVANETVGGRALIEAVRKHAEAAHQQGRPFEVMVVCPQNQPKHGYVVYDEHVRDAAKNRLHITLALLREAGIEADGEVMDPDPYSAVMDALGEQDYDEIIVSTHPETRSGWLRQGLSAGSSRLEGRPPPQNPSIVRYGFPSRPMRPANAPSAPAKAAMPLSMNVLKTESLKGHASGAIASRTMARGT